MIPNRSPECSVRAVMLVKADLALEMFRVSVPWQEAPEAKSGQPKDLMWARVRSVMYHLQLCQEAL